MSAGATPSALAGEAAAALTALVRARTLAVPVDDAFFDRDWSLLWNELAEGGWTAVADGPQPGGDGDFSLLDLTALAEVWGRYLVPLPFIGTLTARRWTAERPDSARKLSYALAADGGWLVPFGEACEDWLTGGPQGSRLTSRTSFVTLGNDVFARSLPISSVSGPSGPLPRVAHRDVAILTTAEAIGAAAAVLSKAVEYAKVREQFGRPIGSFQAVKHRLADMHCRVELARSAVAWCCAEPTSVADGTRAAIELCVRVAEDAIQVHGGIGYTWEASIHRHLRHVMSSRRIVLAAAEEGEAVH